MDWIEVALHTVVAGVWYFVWVAVVLALLIHFVAPHAVPFAALGKQPREDA